MKKANYIEYIVCIIFMLLPVKAFSQNINEKVKQVEAYILHGNGKEAMHMLKSIDTSCLNNAADSTIYQYNYFYAFTLYDSDKFEDAIPYLKNALAAKKRMKQIDCDYIELLYGIGTCYTKVGNLEEAENYLRKTVLRCDNSQHDCGLATKALKDLAEVYEKEGFHNFSEQCTEKISITSQYANNEKSIEDKLSEYQDLIDVYESKGETENEIDAYYKIISFIKANKGIENKDFLLYSYLLGYKLFNTEAYDKAYIIYKELIAAASKFATHYDFVCYAYSDQLQILAKLNKTDELDNLMKEADKYISETPDKGKFNSRYKEYIAWDLYNNNNKDKAITLLESLQNSPKYQYSIRSLDLLSDYYITSDKKKSLNYLLQCKDVMQSTQNVTNSTKINIYEGISFIYSNQEDFSNALEYRKLADNAYENAINSNENINKDNYVQHLVEMATLESRLQHIKEFEIISKKAENYITTKNLDIKHVINLMNGRSMGYIFNNMPDNALSCIHEAMKLIKEKNIESNWPINLYHNEGKAYMLLGKYDDALNSLNLSKELQLQTYGKVMPKTQEYINECENKK